MEKNHLTSETDPLAFHIIIHTSFRELTSINEMVLRSNSILLSDRQRNMQKRNCRVLHKNGATNSL